jgi:CheY-like chemotaxis protein
VRTATSGDDAIALFQAGERFDLVLSDVVMPGAHDGYDVAQVVTSMDPRVPVVLLSGYAPPSDRVDIPIASFIAKPFSRGDLLAAIASVLARPRTNGEPPEQT